MKLKKYLSTILAAALLAATPTASFPFQAQIAKAANPPLKVSCSVSPNPAEVKNPVTFTATATGGIGNYFYQWAGSCHTSARSKNPNCINSFSVSGTYPAVAIVTSGNLIKTATCSVKVSNDPLPPPPPPPPPATNNLIPNPSLEDGTIAPTSWQSSSWGTNTASFNYPVQGPNGAGDKAAKTTITSYPTTDINVGGDAKWYFNPIPVAAGKYYVFSDKYMSTIAGRVVIEFHSGSNLSYQELGSPAASQSWQAFQAGFTVPLGVDSLTIYHLINAVGSLTVDDYSLTETSNPNTFSKGIVSLSFDDGWQTNYDAAVPILNAAGLKSTQYIITGSIGDTADGYMTLDELRAIYQQGHDIAAHTRTHVDLSLPNTDLQSEVNGSRSDLLGYGFSPVDSIAYPYGIYNPTIEAAVSAAGFAGGRTVDFGFNDKTTNPLALKVQVVERGGLCAGDNAPTTTLGQVKNWIDTAAATNTWLILVFHQTDNNSANCYGDTPEMLQNIVNYLKTSNVDVATVSQGLQKMKQ